MDPCDRQRLVSLLCRSELFGDLDEAALGSLAWQMRPLTLAAGDLLCREGETGDRMFAITSGTVSVLKSDAAGGQVQIATLTEGAVAGEMSLFGLGTRSATLQASGRVQAWVLGHADLDELLTRHPSVARGLLASLTRRLGHQGSLVASLLSRDVDRRLRIAFFDSKPYMQEAFEAANRHGYAFRFLESRLTPETVALAAGFRVVCVFVNDQLTADVVEELHKLGVELVALRCAGFNNVNLAACARHGLEVVRVPAYSPHAVAEHAVALMLALNRHLPRACNRVRDGNFSLAGLVGFDMHGKTAGIIGVGKIGLCVLRILNGFGCRLLVHTRTPDTAALAQLNAQAVPLDELLAQSDILSLHAPLTPETHHLIDARAIARLKRGAMIINTGRGALIDTGALLEGLKGGQVGAAGLDVYEEESGYFFEDFSGRVVADDQLARLTTFPNVIVTSHQAFLTREALGGIADTTIESIRQFEQGARGPALPNRVNPPGPRPG